MSGLLLALETFKALKSIHISSELLLKLKKVLASQGFLVLPFGAASEFLKYSEFCVFLTNSSSIQSLISAPARDFAEIGYFSHTDPPNRSY